MLPTAVTSGAGEKDVAEAEGIANPLTINGPPVAVGASVEFTLEPLESPIGAATAAAMRVDKRAIENFMLCVFVFVKSKLFGVECRT